MRRQDLPTLHVSEADLWKQALIEGTVTGSIASVLSTAVLAAAGALQTGSATAAVNAVSHWLWGDESLFAEHPTLRHTLTGYLTQHAASIFWGVLYSRFYGHRDSAKEWPQAVAGGIATSAVAAVVDYGLVPKRLTPGYEHRVSPGAMVAIYGALAAGFALGAVTLGKGGLGRR